MYPRNPSRYVTSVRATGHQYEISHLPVRVRARRGGELGSPRHTNDA